MHRPLINICCLLLILLAAPCAESLSSNETAFMTLLITSSTPLTAILSPDQAGLVCTLVGPPTIVCDANGHVTELMIINPFITELAKLDGISSLNYLQTLTLETAGLENLPAEMGTMTNLTSLTIEDAVSLQSYDVIANMTWLLTLVLEDSAPLASVPSNFNHLFTNLTMSGMGIQSIPATFFSSMTSLQSLDLSKNAQLSSLVFQNALPNLVSLDIDSCNLGSSLPDFTMLTALVNLSMEANHITSLSSSSINSLGSLVLLELDYNFLSGDSSFPSLTSMGGATMTITMENNAMTALPSQLCTISSKITALELGDNLLTWFPNCFTSLTKIDLSNNSFSSWSFLSNISATVKELSIEENNVGSFPTTLANFPLVSELDLSYCGISGPIPTALESLTFLKVNLSHNALNGNIADSFFSGLGGASWDLSYNSFTGSIPASAVNLSLLYISDNLISGVPTNFAVAAAGYALLSLDISRNSFGSPVSFSWPVYTELRMDGNALDAMGITSLDSFQFTAYPATLSVQNTGISGTIPASALNCIYLDISKNSLSGTLPSLFGSTSTKYMMAGNNQLNGSIPLLSSQSLTHLDLSNNQFSGSVNVYFLPNPGSIEYVDISNNFLSGELPAFMTPSLDYVNASNNYFSLCITDPSWLYVTESFPIDATCDFSCNDNSASECASRYANWTANDCAPTPVPPSVSANAFCAAPVARDHVGCGAMSPTGDCLSYCGSIDYIVSQPGFGAGAFILINDSLSGIATSSTFYVTASVTFPSSVTIAVVNTVNVVFASEASFTVNDGFVMGAYDPLVPFPHISASTVALYNISSINSVAAPFQSNAAASTSFVLQNFEYSSGYTPLVYCPSSTSLASVTIQYANINSMTSSPTVAALANFGTNVDPDLQSISIKFSNLTSLSGGYGLVSISQGSVTFSNVIGSSLSSVKSGVLVYAAGASNSISISSSTLSSITSGANGGLVSINGGTISLSSNIITGVTATDNGGLIWANCSSCSVTFTSQYDTISNIRYYGHGGIAYFAGNATVSLIGSNIFSTSSTYALANGGAFYLESTGSVQADNVLASSLMAYNDGGFAYIHNGSIAISGSNFTSINANVGNGGVFFLGTDTGSSITSSSFSLNTCAGNGAVYYTSGNIGSLSVTSSTFTANSATSVQLAGNDIHAELGTVSITISNSIFNHSNNPYGASIYLNAAGSLTTSSCTFLGTSSVHIVANAATFGLTVNDIGSSFTQIPSFQVANVSIQLTGTTLDNITSISENGAFTAQSSIVSFHQVSVSNILNLPAIYGMQSDFLIDSSTFSSFTPLAAVSINQPPNYLNITSSAFSGDTSPRTSPFVYVTSVSPSASLYVFNSTFTGGSNTGLPCHVQADPIPTAIISTSTFSGACSTGGLASSVALQGVQSILVEDSTFTGLCSASIGISSSSKKRDSMIFGDITVERTSFTQASGSQGAPLGIGISGGAFTTNIINSTFANLQATDAYSPGGYIMAGVAIQNLDPSGTMTVQGSSFSNTGVYHFGVTDVILGYVSNNNLPACVYNNTIEFSSSNPLSLIGNTFSQMRSPCETPAWNTCVIANPNMTCVFNDTTNTFYAVIPAPVAPPVAPPVAHPSTPVSSPVTPTPTPTGVPTITGPSSIPITAPIAAPASTPTGLGPITNNSQPPTAKKSLWWISLIVIGIIALALAAFIVFLLWRRKNLAQASRNRRRVAEESAAPGAEPPRQTTWRTASPMTAIAISDLPEETPKTAAVDNQEDESSEQQESSDDSDSSGSSGEEAGEESDSAP